MPDTNELITKTLAYIEENVGVAIEKDRGAIAQIIKYHMHQVESEFKEVAGKMVEPVMNELRHQKETIESQSQQIVSLTDLVNRKEERIDKQNRHIETLEAQAKQAEGAIAKVARLKSKLKENRKQFVDTVSYLCNMGLE